MYWSRLGRNCYRSKTNIHLILGVYWCFLRYAIFVVHLCTCHYNSTFSEDWCSNCYWNWQRQSICFNNNCSHRAWPQKWLFVSYVFRHYQSGDVTWFLIWSLLISCAGSTQLRNSSIFTHSHSYGRTATSSAAKE